MASICAGTNECQHVIREKLTPTCLRLAPMCASTEVIAVEIRRSTIRGMVDAQRPAPGRAGPRRPVPAVVGRRPRLLQARVREGLSDAINVVDWHNGRLMTHTLPAPPNRTHSRIRRERQQSKVARSAGPPLYSTPPPARAHPSLAHLSSVRAIP